MLDEREERGGSSGGRDPTPAPDIVSLTADGERRSDGGEHFERDEESSSRRSEPKSDPRVPRTARPAAYRFAAKALLDHRCAHILGRQSHS